MRTRRGADGNGMATIDPSVESTGRTDAIAALVAFVIAYLAAVPFMNTSLIQGPVAVAWHGADIAYFVDFAVALLIYGGYRVARGRPATVRN
jgi:NCS1 family nucleobase:cation symporter-1